MKKVVAKENSRALSPIRSHRFSRIGRGAVVGIATVGLLGLGIGTAAAAAPAGAAEQDVQTSEVQGVPDYLQVAVLVTSSSSYDLVWSGEQLGHEAYFAGASVLHPGQSTYYVFRQPWSDGPLNVFPSFQVGDTGKFIYPAFSVPLIGANAYLCSADEVDSGSKVKLTNCSIEHGDWQPGAKVTVKDR